MTNYFVNMEIKIEVYFYNLKTFRRSNICGLVIIICIQSWALFNFSAIMPKICLKEEWNVQLNILWSFFKADYG